MATEREFPTAGVMSTVTGRLMGDIGDVYQVLNWMTGESVYTHQIPRICREAVPIMRVEEHERIDPISELAERVHPDTIIVVKT